VKWHTSELRPKFTTTSASVTSGTATIGVTDNYFQVKDLVLIPVSGELVMVTATAAGSIDVVRSWGATAAATAASGVDLMIVGPHYEEGAALQAGRTVTEVQYTNSVALWRHNFQITGTLEAIGAQGGTYHGTDVDLQREDMMLVHKRDINLACIFSETGSSGSQRSMDGLIPFVRDNGTNRTNNTSAVTFSVFSTAMKTATRYNSGKMLGIVSRLGAQIVSEWALANNAHVMLEPGAKLFGLQIMDVVTPHGTVRLLVDNALEGTYGQRYWILLDANKKTGPKWRYLRDTRLIKNRNADGSMDAYSEEVLTEGTIELGNPNYHYLFTNAQTSS
jgi:hypothetical protein